MSNRHMNGLVAAALALVACLGLTGCQSPVSGSVQAGFAAQRAEGDEGAGKVFVTSADWSYLGWTVRKGATVTFRQDGLGEFECLLSQPRNGEAGLEMSLEIVAANAGGERLFVAPGSDAGARIGIVPDVATRPYRLRFGFDRRAFELIDQVEIRTRFDGVPAAGAASSGGAGRRSSLFGSFGRNAAPVPPAGVHGERAVVSGAP